MGAHLALAPRAAANFHGAQKFGSLWYQDVAACTMHSRQHWHFFVAVDMAQVLLLEIAAACKGIGIYTSNWMAEIGQEFMCEFNLVTISRLVRK